MRKYGIGLTEDVKKLAGELREEYESLTEYEALDIALKSEMNILYEAANVISEQDKHPTALEKIAMELSEIVGLLDR